MPSPPLTLLAVAWKTVFPLPPAGICHMPQGTEERKVGGGVGKKKLEKLECLLSDPQVQGLPLSVAAQNVSIPLTSISLDIPEEDSLVSEICC